jgi:hypothetical protein
MWKDAAKVKPFWRKGFRGEVDHGLRGKPSDNSRQTIISIALNNLYLKGM